MGHRPQSLGLTCDCNLIQMLFLYIVLLPLPEELCFCIEGAFLESQSYDIKTVWLIICNYGPGATLM